MDTLPVTIIVKAPNQQFEDQTIKCEPTWSIRRLKGYLSEVYPCNPALEEQKLIYSGQLLNDAHILKDVLRQYEGQDTHTVHLVYTPKNRQFAPSTTKRKVDKDISARANESRTSQPTINRQSQHSENNFGSDGLRYQNSGIESSTNQMPSQTPPFMTGYLNMSQQFMPAMTFAQQNINQAQFEYTPEQYALAQQMAMQNMMHQMYLQYMNQYANAMQQSNSMSNPPQYFSQSNFGATPFGANNTNSTDSNTDDQIRQPNQEAPQPPRIQAAVDDDIENRDWLEILYTLSRLLVLLSLVYFYSSPSRCMIVILAFVVYYFYQNHQRNLRDRQQTERLQEVGREPDVIEAPIENIEQQNENIADTEQRDQRELPSLINSDSETSTTSLVSGVESDENNRLPAITLLRTFILSFFSSLLPTFED